MVDLDDTVLEQARSRSETLTLDDLVRFAETYHPDDRPGISRDVFDVYRQALGYDSEEVTAELDERRTDTREWVGNDVIYDLGDDRISTFPLAWHEKLGDTTDLTEYVEVIQTDVEENRGQTEERVGEAGVSEQLLFEVMAAIGGVEREEAREQLAALRREGVVEESTDQHPAGTVRLS
jgi:hypothetical protein